jgi:hypothetical protein
VKTKIVQLAENSHSVFSVQQVDAVQPSSSNRAKPALPELLPDFKLCCTFTSLCAMNIKEMSAPSRLTVDDELADYASGLSVKPNDVFVAALIDPQHFWLQNISKYPTLGHLALDLISAPASEAYSERVFSYCGLLTTGRSNKLGLLKSEPSCFSVSQTVVCDHCVITSVNCLVYEYFRHLNTI